MYKLLILNNDDTEEIKRYDSINDYNLALDSAIQLIKLGIINSVEELHRA